MTKGSVIKIVIVLAVVVGLIGLYFFTPLGDYLSIEKITELTEKVPKTFGTALIFLGIFFVGGSLLVPVPLMAFALSLVFNIWLSVLIAIPGFFLASLSGYFVGKLIGTDSFDNKLKDSIEKVKDKVDEKGAWALLALRLAPTPPFTVTSVISGAIGINLWKFALGSTLGIAPLALSAIFFGEGAIEMMKDPSGLAASSIVAAVILFILYKVVKGKHTSSDA